MSVAIATALDSVVSGDQSETPGRTDEEMRASERDCFECCDTNKLALSIVVLGASGDLAKKKTYPALFALFEQEYVTASSLLPFFVARFAWHCRSG
jgi:hypothetical protein